jgi:ADP-heptose:LPS heptosyltransferase
LKKPAHILVIRLSALGDVAMAVPVLVALTQRYPEVKITLLTRPFFAPLFADIPQVNVFPVDLKNRHKGFAGLIRLFRDLKKLRLNAVADLHQVLRSMILSTLFWLSGTTVKTIHKGRLDKKRLTRPENKVWKQLKTTHQRYADVFEKLGFPISPDRNALLAKKPIGQLLVKLNIDASKKLIGIAPFAKFPSKTYPKDLMLEVIQLLDKTGNYSLLLFGAPNEFGALEFFSNNRANTFNLAGKLTFTEELQLISKLDLMLSMDSGNAHLAANFGVPVITLWGVTHPYAGFAPFNQPMENALLSDRTRYPQIPTSVFGKIVPKDYEDCMRTIEPRMVVDRVEEVLELSC